MISIIEVIKIVNRKIPFNYFNDSNFFLCMGNPGIFKTFCSLVILIILTI